MTSSQWTFKNGSWGNWLYVSVCHMPRISPRRRRPRLRGSVVFCNKLHLVAHYLNLFIISISRLTFTFFFTYRHPLRGGYGSVWVRWVLVLFDSNGCWFCLTQMGVGSVWLSMVLFDSNGLWVCLTQILWNVCHCPMAFPLPPPIGLSWSLCSAHVPQILLLIPESTDLK